MKNSFFLIHLIVLVIVFMFSFSDRIFSGEKNLVANPSFETGGKAVGQEYNQNGWTYFAIEEPAEGKIVGNAKDGKSCFEIRTQKGRGFLHSDVFPVEASSDLTISVWTKGNGKAAVEVLWWKEYNDDIVNESEHHRDVLKEFDAAGKWKQINISAKVPKDAKFAYIRLTAKGGNICFDNIIVK
ncbi:hypothetical protein KAS50_00395 [bacterium]|nr:hypothetical protein [bacterium]